MAKNKNRVSPANIVAVIAVAALGVITFFGALFQSEDGSISSAVIKAAVFTFGIGLLLVFCIVTKTVESEFKKWRVIEYICLAAYIAVAVAFYKPFLQFFHVVQHKEELQNQALDEISEINDMCENFNIHAEDDMSKAAQGIKNYTDSRQAKSEVDGGLAEYVKSQLDDKNIEDYNDWEEDSYNLHVRFNQESLDDLRQRIELWNYMDLSAIAFDMSNKAVRTWDDLDDHIVEIGDEYKLVPVISYVDHLYRYDGLVDYSDVIGSRPESSKFTQRFREPISGFNIGIIIYVVLHLLALMNYFLVRRSPIIEIKKGNQNDDSGLPLKLEM